MSQIDVKTLIVKQFNKAVESVNPVKLIRETVKLENGKLYIQNKVYNSDNHSFYMIGFGKAVLGMALECEKIFGNNLKHGVICIPENQGTEFASNKNSKIEIFEGAKNNLPDKNAEKGVDAAIKLVNQLNSEKDYLIVLISGGGSALFPKPKDGIKLPDVLSTIKQLVTSGADITELNTVRKKLSKVKGGGLACLSYPTRTITLILSDVIDDPLDIIASGPTVPNSDSNLTAYNIIKKYKLENTVPKPICNALLEVSSNQKIPVVDNNYTHVDNFVIGNNKTALDAAKAFAEINNFKSVIFSNSVSGLVDYVAEIYSNFILEIFKCLKNHNIQSKLEDITKRCNFKFYTSFAHELHQIMHLKDLKRFCIIAGGEITVKLKGSGKGGRNQELALIMSKKINDIKKNMPDVFEKYNVLFLSAGTDGIDGPTDAAGAIGEADLIDIAKKNNIDIEQYLLNNDSYNFYNKLENGNYLIKTGHTGTNVMDIHIILFYEK